MSKWMPCGDGVRRWLGLLCGVAIAIMGAEVWAAGITDVPVRNSASFGIQRDRLYDLIERLALSGLVDGVVLNTRPMSRLEMARIVLQAINRIRAADDGAWNDRGDMEETLNELIEGLGPELAALGLPPGVAEASPPGFLTLRPIERVQTRFGYATNDVALENAQGEGRRKGGNGRLALSGRAEVGDVLAFYANPEVSGTTRDRGGQGRLVEGYVKAGYRNVELTAGRESLWWGPGYHGSMLFSNNAQGLDQIRLASREAFTLPWPLEYLGPTKVALFVARLEANRDFPHAMVSGFRVNSAPTRFLEVGFGRAIQFGGQGKESLGPLDYPRAIFSPFNPREENDPRSKFSRNQLFSVDATVRIPDVDRVLPISRDLQLYWEMGVDDTCCETFFIPIKPANLFGIYLPNFLRSSDTDLRVEYAYTNTFNFTHFQYSSGFAIKGSPLSHFIGTKGNDLFFRIARRMSKRLLLGTSIDYARIGSPLFPGNFDAINHTAKQVSFYNAVDLSYQFARDLSAQVVYRFQRVGNFEFRPGIDKSIHFLEFGITKSF